MGNSPSGSGPRLLANGKYCSYHIQLDNAVTITVIKHPENSEKWELKYEVDGMTCRLSISRNTQRSSENLWITVADLIPNIQKQSTGVRPQRVLLHVIVKKEKKNYGFLCEQFELVDTLFKGAKETQSGGSRRGEVETSFWAYGCGTRMGLLVTETKKKKSNEEESYMATVAHYYVNSASGGNCVDIGFSVVVKIGLHNGELDFSVDGPLEHPSSALLYMIDEVIRTGTWKC